MDARADHPHTDPGDGRTECQTCGKWIFEAIHSCKGFPVTDAAWERFYAIQLKHWCTKCRGQGTCNENIGGDA